jgi:mono/diheme cytochrome c family protein
MWRAAWLLILAVSVVLGCRPGENGASSTLAEGPGATAEERSAAGSPEEVEDASVWVTPMPDLDYNSREGRRLYRYYCASCHGDEGHGDGFNAYNLDPKPRDLADPEFQLQRTDEEISAIVRSGGGVAGMSTGMPPWGRTLNDRQIENLTSYLRRLRRQSESEP